jgi:glucokinase-like ROK family protein
MITGNQEKVRKVNRSLVLNTLRLHAPISRAQVADFTGLTRGTVSNIVNVLIQDGLVFEDKLQDSKIGRPSILLGLRPEGGGVVGVEIGVDFISVLLTNFVAETLWEIKTSILSSQSQTEVINQTDEYIDQALSIAKDRKLRPLGIGVGLPGLVNVRQGNLVVAPNLHWKNVPLRLILNQRFQLPVYIDNEANLAALGEYYFGVARGVDNFIYLSSNIGLGGGIMINGRLFRGGHGYGGEVGHIQRNPLGEQCGCGRTGCWETQVGLRAVLQRIVRELQLHPDQSLLDACSSNLDNLTFDIVVKFALSGNVICRKALEEVAVNLGSGIADLVNIFNPDLIVIGGAFNHGKEIMQSVIEKTICANALQPAVENFRVTFTEHNSEACVMGAVAVVLDDILREMVIN